MPFLFSHLIVKRFLSMMAALNLAMLGECAYLYFAPMEKPVAAGDAGYHSNISALASAIPEKPGVAGAPFQSNSNESISAVNWERGVAMSKVAAADPELHSVYSNELNDPAGNEQPRIDTTGDTENPAHAGPGGQIQGTVVVGGGVTGEPAQVTAPKVPLSFTTSPEGATPEQAAALGQLQNDFVKGLGQNADPNSAQYRDWWNASQALNDSNYRQKFGWQAFVQAQLAQYRGGVK